MEIGQIEAFVEAQRRGSITRAAEALELTQPTLTARVRSLEAELGVTLLTRGRRGVALTPAGRRFLPRALAALDALERAAAEARAGREVKGGTLALGLASDVAVYLAPPALARFARRYPDVDVRVVSGRSRAIAEALRADEIEAGIVSQLVVLPDLAGRPLFDEAVPAVVAASHPLAKRAKVTLDEVASAGLVLRDPASFLHALTVTYFAAGGSAPRILMELDNTEAVKRVVLSGLGAALLPEMAIRDELRRGELVALSLARPAPRRTISLLLRSGAEPSAAALALLRIMRPG